LETGGGVIKAKEFLKDDTFLTLNVDILTELNLKYFLSFHQQQQSLITLAVSDRDTSRYWSLINTTGFADGGIKKQAKKK
jgi:NDP-sugar pyrophosphorylase family protein